MQKDVSRFFVAQAAPEIYKKNEMLKNRGDFLLFTVPPDLFIDNDTYRFNQNKPSGA